MRNEEDSISQNNLLNKTNNINDTSTSVKNKKLLEDDIVPNELELKIDQIGILSCELNEEEYLQVHKLE